jgi:uncharacterized protein YecT (DUF1311 family)
MILAALLFVAAAPNVEREPDCTSDDLPQQEMNYCAAQDFWAADAELNAQWKITADAMRQMDASDPADDGRPGYYQTLLDGQRGWLKYRDGQCDSEGYAFRGGSMEPFIVGGCRARLTRARTQELRELVPGEN